MSINHPRQLTLSIPLTPVPVQAHTHTDACKLATAVPQADQPDKDETDSYIHLFASSHPNHLIYIFFLIATSLTTAGTCVSLSQAEKLQPKQKINHRTSTDGVILLANCHSFSIRVHRLQSFNQDHFASTFRRSCSSFLHPSSFQENCSPRAWTLAV